MIPAHRKPRQEDHKFEASVCFLLGSNEEEREEEEVKEKKKVSGDIWVPY